MIKTLWKSLNNISNEIRVFAGVVFANVLFWALVIGTAWLVEAAADSIERRDERIARREYLEEQRLKYQRDMRRRQRARALREKAGDAAPKRSADAVPRSDLPDCYINAEEHLESGDVALTVSPQGGSVRLSVDGCGSVTVDIKETSKKRTE